MAYTTGLGATPTKVEDHTDLVLAFLFRAHVGRKGIVGETDTGPLIFTGSDRGCPGHARNEQGQEGGKMFGQHDGE